MNILLRSMAIIGVLFCLTPANAQIKILCLGDSITEGYFSESYRLPLWIILTSRGYSVDFVGPQSGTFQGPSGFVGFNEQEHAGWSAVNAEFFVNGNRARNIASTYQPDIALIHIGTNDIGNGGGAGAANQTIAEIEQIIDQLRSQRPNLIIFLAEVIPSRAPFGSYNQVTVLNNQIPALAASKSTAASPVISVDMETRFELYDNNNWWFYMQDDRLHTNGDGDTEMATRWFNAMKPYLGNPDISVISPANNASYTVGDMVSVNAVAADDLGVASVQYYLNGEADEFFMAPPYSYSFPLTQSGPVTITAVATDTDGLTTHSLPVTFNVNGPSTTAFLGMSAWYRADAGIVDDGSGKMLVWLDQSGNDNHQLQVNPAKRPYKQNNLFGNQPGIRFSGGQSMTSWVGMPRESYTKVVITRLNRLGGGSIQNNIIGSGTTPYGAHSFWFSETNRLKMYHHHNDNFDASNFVTSSIGTDVGSPTILMGTYDLGTSTGVVYNDNVFGGSGTVATRNNSPNIQLGSFLENFYLDGDIAEIMIFPRVLNSSERTTLYNYLKTKYIDQNTAPILATIQSQAGHAGQPISFTAVAVDADPGQTLTWTISGVSGASVAPTTGLVNYTPAAAGTYNAIITVTDSGTPAASDSQVVPFTVGAPLTFSAYELGIMHRLEWNGMSQLQYILEHSPSYTAPAWSVIATLPGQNGPMESMIAPGPSTTGMYRLRY